MVGKERRQGSQEIERKFLVLSLPNNLDQFRFKELRQGYVLVGTEGNMRI